MKREFLEKLGLSKEIIDKILDERGKEVETHKNQLAEAEASKKKAEELVAERDSQIAALSTSKGNAEELQGQIQKLQADNKAAAEKHTQEIAEIRRNNAVSSALATAKAKNEQAAKALLDMSKITIADDGTVLGIEEQLKALREGENTKFLFGEPESQVTGVKPVNTPGATPTSPDEQDMQNWRAEAGL